MVVDERGMGVDELPVVVVGAGPIGLAAAAHIRERGVPVVVFERGPVAGFAVAQWHHVRLFSRWSELIDPAAARLLAGTGWTAPDPNRYPTGKQWAADYLAPVAAALGDVVQFGSEVIGVARRGRDRVVDDGRDREPLSVYVRTAESEYRVPARAVIDASGTWNDPNPLGGEGLPALGERSATGVVGYRIPDLSESRAEYLGAHTVVAGSGHSALTAIDALSSLVRDDPATRITWALRRGAASFGGGAADQLPARGALGLRAQAAVEAGLVTVVTGFRTARITVGADGRAVLESDAGGRIEGVDRVVALTGFRPDLSWLSEIRLELDPVLQSPTRLAPLIDPNVHSCGTVYPHGVQELSHPEPNVYLAGMKSYGRAPTFLALTGYEQVRSIAAALAGDHESAQRVELTLPESGVCGGSGVFDDAEATGGGCCAAPPGPQPISLSVGPAA